ncbi:MOSC domain-containing protein [Arsenicicoccus sp. oral taxon 190]|uniref:MOSC domain-containing protein n=1 Tax=Arsenicicoccus sp. oral taxon 190 TaxID=1658671 RepID=UPI0012E11BAC|nr:MOSC domain-containing protein [Arsenicicoccus sp. oral taxon 190]
MGGESLGTVDVDARGLVLDRWYAVTDREGCFASGKDTRRFRRRDAVFDYRAAVSESGVVVTGPEGSWLVGDEDLDHHLSRRMGTPVMVLPEADVPHQDMGAVSVVGTATLEWCRSRWDIDADPRRLRVNVLLETSEPFVEETWAGREISLGSVTLVGAQRIPRCRMVDVAQDGAIPDGRWLKPLAAERDMFLAMYADVRTPGTVAVGDLVTVSPAPR